MITVTLLDMMKRMISMGLLVTVAIAGYVWSTRTTESEASDGDQDKQTGYERGKDLAEQRGSEQAMPSEEEMMQAWMEYATPNEHHAKLEAWVGNWQIQTKMWQMPGAPLEESTMYSEARMIMDGRYLHETATGEFDMGGGQMMPFEGTALIGYDNHKGEYFSHWIDNFGTGIWIETGDFNDDGIVDN